jgi:hypothetical protein
MHPIERLGNRLKRIGINIVIHANYPWMYLGTINGVRVKETIDSDHGFVIGYEPIRAGQEFKWVNTQEMFKLIRKYIT